MLVGDHGVGLREADVYASGLNLGNNLSLPRVALFLEMAVQHDGRYRAKGGCRFRIRGRTQRPPAGIERWGELQTEATQPYRLLQRSSLLSGIEWGDGAHGTQKVSIGKEAAVSGRYESEAEKVSIRVGIVTCKC
jgi:hypothetical protein